MKILGTLLIILGGGCLYLMWRIMTTGEQTEQAADGILICAVVGLLLFITGVMQFKKKK